MKRGDTGWEPFGLQRTLVVGKREVTMWIEEVHRDPCRFEWHLSADGYDDEGRAISFEEGKRFAHLALGRFRMWARWAKKR